MHGGCGSKNVDISLSEAEKPLVPNKVRRPNHELYARQVGSPNKLGFDRRLELAMTSSH